MRKKWATDFRIGKLFILFIIEGLPFSSFYKKTETKEMAFYKHLQINGKWLYKYELKES